jgi:predicted RNase H-like nuclease
MLIKEEVIKEDGQGIIKQVTYERLGTVEKFRDIDALIREISYILRHTQHKIIKMVIEEGKNICYTQIVSEKKVNQEGLNEKT